MQGRVQQDRQVILRIRRLRDTLAVMWKYSYCLRHCHCRSLYSQDKEAVTCLLNKDAGRLAHEVDCYRRHASFTYRFYYNRSAASRHPKKASSKPHHKSGVGPIGDPPGGSRMFLINTSRQLTTSGLPGRPEPPQVRGHTTRQVHES